MDHDRWCNTIACLEVREKNKCALLRECPYYAPAQTLLTTITHQITFSQVVYKLQHVHINELALFDICLLHSFLSYLLSLCIIIIAMQLIYPDMLLSLLIRFKGHGNVPVPSLVVRVCTYRTSIDTIHVNGIGNRPHTSVEIH